MKVYVSHNKFGSAALKVSSPSGKKISIEISKLDANEDLKKKVYGINDVVEISLKEMMELYNMSHSVSREESSNIMNLLRAF